MIWMTCLLDGKEHAVADREVVAGRERGRYLGVCGKLVTPGALSCPPGRRCLVCHATLAPARAAPPRRRSRLALRPRRPKPSAPDRHPGRRTEGSRPPCRARWARCRG